MNFRFIKEVESGKFRTDVILADRDSGELFCDKLRQVFLELPCFKKEEEECETNFERWIYTLKNMDSLERMPFKLKQAVFDKLKEVTDVASLSKEERIKYDNSVKIYRDYLVTMEFEKQEREAVEQEKEATKQEAKAEGVVIGEARGEAIGLEKGKQEAQLRTASELKKRGVAPEIIAQCTTLSIDEIKEL